MKDGELMAVEHKLTKLIAHCPVQETDPSSFKLQARKKDSTQGLTYPAGDHFHIRAHRDPLLKIL